MMCHFSPLVHTLVPAMPARDGPANTMTAPEKDLVEAIPTMHLLLLLSAALQPMRAHDNPSKFSNAHALPSMPFDRRLLTPPTHTHRYAAASRACLCAEPSKAPLIPWKAPSCNV